MSTSAAEEAVKALGEHDDVLLLNALKLVASIAAHPGRGRNGRQDDQSLNRGEGSIYQLLLLLLDGLCCKNSNLRSLQAFMHRADIGCSLLYCCKIDRFSS